MLNWWEIDIGATIVASIFFVGIVIWRSSKTNETISVREVPWRVLRTLICASIICACIMGIVVTATSSMPAVATGMVLAVGGPLTRFLWRLSDGLVRSHCVP